MLNKNLQTVCGPRCKNTLLGIPVNKIQPMHSMTLAPKTSLSRAVPYSVRYVVSYLGTCHVLSHPQLPIREAQLTAFILTQFSPLG